MDRLDMDAISPTACAGDVPSFENVATWSVPPARFVPPVYWLVTPVRISVPAPAFTSAPEPVTFPANVAVVAESRTEGVDAA